MLIHENVLFLYSSCLVAIRKPCIQIMVMSDDLVAEMEKEDTRTKKNCVELVKINFLKI